MAGKHVLVVDDEPTVRELLDGLLKHCGYTTHLAASGEEALECLDKTHFDLVITDLHMPGMNGEELAAEIQNRGLGTPVVLVTGDPKASAQLPVHRVLQKPFSLRQLKAALSGLT
jgi:CheY-like chemotaxis protein